MELAPRKSWAERCSRRWVAESPTALRMSGELAAGSFSGMPAERKEAQREQCPVARPCMASRCAWRQCLALAARLALERPAPKPLQLRRAAARAEQRSVAGSGRRAKAEPRALLAKCLRKQAQALQACHLQRMRSALLQQRRLVLACAPSTLSSYGSCLALACWQEKLAAAGHLAPAAASGARHPWALVATTAKMRRRCSSTEGH